MKRRILAILLVVSMVNSGTNCVRAENIGAERVAENVEELAEESSLETKDDENKQKEENQTEENELCKKCKNNSDSRLYCGEFGGMWNE